MGSLAGHHQRPPMCLGPGVGALGPSLWLAREGDSGKGGLQSSGLHFPRASSFHAMGGWGSLLWLSPLKALFPGWRATLSRGPCSWMEHHGAHAPQEGPRRRPVYSTPCIDASIRQLARAERLASVAVLASTGAALTKGMQT
jgi:hypothetical protein